MHEWMKEGMFWSMNSIATSLSDRPSFSLSLSLSLRLSLSPSLSLSLSLSLLFSGRLPLSMCFCQSLFLSHTQRLIGRAIILRTPLQDLGVVTIV